MLLQHIFSLNRIKSSTFFAFVRKTMRKMLNHWFEPTPFTVIISLKCQSTFSHDKSAINVKIHSQLLCGYSQCLTKAFCEKEALLSYRTADTNMKCVVTTSTDHFPPFIVFINNM